MGDPLPWYDPGNELAMGAAGQGEGRIERRSVAAIGLIILLLAGSVLLALQEQAVPGQEEQESLPADHPPTPDQGTRSSLNKLTDQVAPHLQGGPSSPIVRQNLIDEHIFAKMEKEGIPWAPLSSDEEFFRRIHLDLWGRLPDSESARKFLKDSDPGKRDKLIEEMLALDQSWEDLSKKEGYDPNDPATASAEREMNVVGPWLVDTAFVSRWSYWFSDLFGNSRALLADGRNAFYHYIYDSLRLNLPYNKFVADMMTATTVIGRASGPANFLIRCQVGDPLVDGPIVHEDTLDEIAIRTSKYFLGIDLECVSCHDGARHLESINLWLTKRKRPEVWRQAAFFGNIRLFRPTWADNNFALLEGPPLLKYKQFHEGGTGYSPTARSVVRVPRFQTDVYPEFILGGERPQAGQNPRQEYARILTSHPQFARATVNLIWAELMGVGIVDPPFGWDLDRQDPQDPPPAPWTIQPTHPELLQVLAEDFRRHNFDLRRLIALITKSSAYQLSSRFPGRWKEEYSRYFARRSVRRLPAEMIFDAICKATNVFETFKTPSGDVHFVLETYSHEDVEDPAVKQFLKHFGQGDRDVNDPVTDGSIIQASVLLNSDIVKKRVLPSTENSRVGALLGKAPLPSNDEIVEELFLSTLGRFPGDEERAVCVKQLEERRDRGAEDIQWALLNKLKFLFNY